MLSVLSVTFLVISFPCIFSIKSNVTSSNFEKFYEDGVDAYLDEKWQECMDNMETAIYTYKLSLAAMADCRIKCQNEPFEPLVKKDIEDLHHYEKMIKRTLCFIKCKRIRYPNVEFNVVKDVKVFQTMENLTPYTYLHICYFNKKLLHKAASAAFTYLVKHPDDKEMKRNFDYYLSLPEINVRDVTNFETPEYFPLYLHGMNSYNNEDWEAVISYMEESLLAYFSSEQRCRALCEGSFDQGWLPDFTTSVSNHFTYCLKCKKLCLESLKTLNGMKGKEIIADIYNYLQISYYNVKKLSQAFRCVASYLLIYPSDETMMHNKKLYSELADPTEFVPRPEIVHYLLREEYEDKLLQFIDQSFTAEFQMNQEKEVKESPKSEESNEITDNNL